LSTYEKPGENAYANMTKVKPVSDRFADRQPAGEDFVTGPESQASLIEL